MSATKYTKSEALSMVIANMIGVGVFSSLGFQVIPFEKGGIPDVFAILFIWLLGGLIALCGATVYAEVSTTMKRSGGEYVYLSKLYHPSIGFASGWISLVVGFSGAIASAGLAIGKYSLPFLGIGAGSGVPFLGALLPNQKIVGIVVILLLTGVHLLGVRAGGLVQNLLTAFKVGLIAVFCLMPFFLEGSYGQTMATFSWSEIDHSMIFSLSFASALVWVMYAYSGWNAVTYIAEHVVEPVKTIPMVLIGGTLIVTVIYVVLNASFLYACSFEELAFQEDIGNIVATKVWGEPVAVLFSGLFSLALFSTMSAMIMAGPRVTEQVGQDFAFFRKLSVKGAGGTPTYAILLQSLIAIVLVVFSSFQDIIQTLGLTLSFFSLLTVVGVFIVRKRFAPEERPVKAWGYPLTPMVFILATLWMIVSFALVDPSKIWYSLLAILPGILIYYVLEK